MKTEKKLYIVEFGRPSPQGFHFSSAGAHEPLYVVAGSYDEAAAKAITYVEHKTSVQNILDSDGSLRNFDSDVNVKMVKLACDEIVW